MTPLQNERREFVPLIIAGIIAAVCLLYLWVDLFDDLPAHRVGAITSTATSGAGAMVTPSGQAGDISAPQAAPAAERATVGSGTH